MATVELPDALTAADDGKEVKEAWRSRQIRKYLDEHERKLAYAKTPAVDLATVQYEPIEFLIPHFLPRGTLMVAAGVEGIGKGLMGVSFAHQVLRETKLNVLIMSTEDDESEVIGRLEADGWKVKTGRVFYFDSPRPVDFLRDFIKEHKIGLVILDGVRDFMPVVGNSRSNNDDGTVRPALLALRKLAKDTGAAIMGLHHLNKATHDTNGKRLSVRQMLHGAGAFAHVPRHVIVLVENDEHELVVGVHKSNIYGKGWLRRFDRKATSKGTGVHFEWGLPGEYDHDLTLDDWLKRNDPDAAIKLVVDADEALVIVRDAARELTKDGNLPSRDVLCARVKADDVTQAQVKAVLATLQATGEVVKKGRGLAWV